MSNSDIFVELQQRILPLSVVLGELLLITSPKKPRVGPCCLLAPHLKVSIDRIITMKLVLLSLLAGSAAAFAPAQSGKVSSYGVSFRGTTSSR